MERPEVDDKMTENEQKKPFFRKPEILAPAGSMEALRAAVCAGADAVYIGGQSFGARAFADNPDTEELLEAIAYTHLRKKRLYLTVNTLIKEQEFGALYDFLAPFYAAGLDAAIVQDVGAMRFLAKEFPELPLHASTQMTLTGALGLSVLEGYPVTRLVPARELSLTELTELCSRTEREVEIFVHGALCYCYSGQCLMSSMIGGRSGNRGRCAQPCRMEYKTEEGRSGYLLSPKDLCGLSVLPELIRTGAASFKIEGRMKRPEYAAAVTAAYREEVDRYEQLGEKGYLQYRREHPKFLEKKLEELADVYNRGGFTTGCFQKKSGPQLMSMRRPGHFGVPVGQVTAETRGRAEFVLTKDVFAQDVLEFRRKNGAREGIPAYYEYTLGEGACTGQKLSARMLPKLTAQKGDLVYRMRNAALLERLDRDFGRQERKIPVRGRFTAKSGEYCRLTVSASCAGLLPPRPFSEPETVTVEICHEGFVCEAAGKLPATADAVKKQLERTGREEFLWEELQIELADAVFLPNGKLNELRREAFAELLEKLRSCFARELPERPVQVPVSPGCPGEDFFLDCVVRTEEQALAAANVGEVRRIYVELLNRPEEEEEALLSQLQQYGKEIYYTLPHVLRPGSRQRLEKELPERSEWVQGYLVRNLEELGLLAALKTEREKPVVLDSNLYVMNQNAREVYAQYFGGRGFELTAPVELSAAELGALSINGMNLMVYGRIPLMVSAHCVRNNTSGCRPENTAQPLYLVDRVGKRLPVLCVCRDCYNLIFNPEILNLLTERQAIEQLGPGALRFDFTFETPAEVRKLLKGGFLERTDGAGYTRGHFKRGVW